MKNLSLIFLFSVTLLISCEQNLNPDEILKNNIPMVLRINKNNQINLNNTDTIRSDSEIYDKFKKWMNLNKTGWEESYVSYATPIASLIGGDFRLLIFENFVVVGYDDKLGNLKQFTKSINKSEFDFLFQKKRMK